MWLNVKNSPVLDYPWIDSVMALLGLLVDDLKTIAIYGDWSSVEVAKDKTL